MFVSGRTASVRDIFLDVTGATLCQIVTWASSAGSTRTAGLRGQDGTRREVLLTHTPSSFALPNNQAALQYERTPSRFCAEL